MLLAAVVALGPLTARCDETTADHVIGQWKTPGGNVVSIDGKAGGSLAGIILELADAAGADGFKLDDVVLKDFALGSGNDLKFQVGVRPLQDKDCPTAFQTFSGTIQGDAMTGKIPAAHFEGCSLVAEPDNPEAEVTYSRVICDCLAPLGREDIFRVSPQGNNTVTVELAVDDPLAKADASPAVAARTVSGNAVQRTEIAWKITSAADAKLSTTFYTNTDVNGVARLQFLLLPSGEFIVANQMKTRSATLPAGRFTVEATTSRMPNPQPAKLDLTLKRHGLLLNFTTANRSRAIQTITFAEPVSGNSDPRNARFGLELADFGETQPAASQRVHLTSYGAGQAKYDEIDVDLVPANKAGGILYVMDGKPVAAAVALKTDPVPIITGVFRSVLRLPRDQPIITVVAEATGADGPTRQTLTIYSDPYAEAREVLKRTLDGFQSSLDGITASVQDMKPGFRAAVADKQRLINVARRILFDPALETNGAPLINIDVVTQYVRLIASVDDPKPDTGKEIHFKRIGLYPDLAHAGDDYNIGTPFKPATTSERGAITAAQAMYLANRENGLQANANAIIRALGLDVPPNVAIPAAGITLARGAGIYAVTSVAGGLPIILGYASLMLWYGVNLEGESLDLLDFAELAVPGKADFLFMGLQKYFFDAVFHTDGLTRLRQLVAELRGYKRAVLAEASEFAAKKGWKELTEEERGLAIQLQRFEKLYEQETMRIVKMPGLSNEAKGLLHDALLRIVDSTAAEYVRRHEMELPVNSPRMRIGMLEHWRNQLERVAFNEGEVKAGRRERVAPGRYRWTDDKGAILEEFVEYQLQSGGRIDHALGKRSPDETFIMISDNAAQLDWDHIRKGRQYARDFTETEPGYKKKKKSYCEYYWDEKSGDFVPRLVGVP